MIDDTGKDSTSVAFQDLVENSERFIQNRLDLLRLDAQVWIRRWWQTIACLIISILLFLGCWVMLMITTVLVLERWVPNWGAVLSVALLHLVLALICLGMAKRLGR